MLKSRNVLWEVLRPVVGWPLRSPLRLFLVVAGLVLAGWTVSQLSSETDAPVEAGDETGATATATLGPETGDTAEESAPPPGGRGPATAEPVEEQGTGAAGSGEEDLVTEAPGGEDQLSVPGDGGHGHDHADEDEWVTLGPDDPTPVFDPEGEQEKEIADVAVAAVQAMARPGRGVAEQDWWEEFATHLTPQARSDYEETDPTQVPWAEVDEELGGKMLPRVEGTPGLLRMVQVLTDAGPVTVYVQLDDEGWAVSRITWDDLPGLD